MAETDVRTFEDSGGGHHPEPNRLLPHLFLVLECDRPTAGGVRYGLEGLRTIEFGRAGERSAHVLAEEPSKLRVGVPGRSMSGAHARIVVRDGGFVLEDSGSTNGSL